MGWWPFSNHSQSDDEHDWVQGVFDRFVYCQFDNDELAEHLITEGVVNDLMAEGRTEDALRIVWDGLPTDED
jgi:hypothetical protein